MTKEINRYEAAKKVSILGIIANLILFLIKLLVAFVSKSQSLIADTVNSGTDIFSSVMTYIGSKLSGMPEDKEHPYGHGKVEYVFTLIISIFMIILGFTILYQSISAIVKKQVLVFSWNLIYVCILTIIVKAALYIYTSKLGKKHENLLITANSEDHRNDVFVTIGVLIGVIGSKYGIYWLDGLVRSTYIDMDSIYSF